MLMIIVMLSLFLPLIQAETSNITKTDFYVEPQQAYRLQDGDGISFVKDEKEYVITVDEIGKTSTRLKSFAYKDDGSRETFYILLNVNYDNKVDFEKDEVYDMIISLVKVSEDNSEANIYFEAINEPKIQIIGETALDNNPNKNNELRNGLLIMAGIIVLGLLIYFIFRKRR